MTALRWAAFAGPSPGGVRPSYRQAALFLDDLHRRDADAFRALVLAVEDGTPVDDAMKASFGLAPRAAWQRYADEVRAAR